LGARRWLRHSSSLRHKVTSVSSLVVIGFMQISVCLLPCIDF
jgi:hypothetical protein